MSHAKKTPSQQELLEYLDYDKDTGSLYWKKSTNRNNIVANKPAGWIDKEGYYTLSFKKKFWRAHRLIWKMVYNEDPKYVYHDNGITTDNRITNLKQGVKSAET